jgi:hypothetical protein
VSRKDPGIFRLDRALRLWYDAFMTDQPTHLPLARFDPSLFEGWISLAADHLMNSLDTAIDELQRDRDFIDDAHLGDHDGVNSPYFIDERANCINLAVARFLKSLDALQEGDDTPPAVKGCLIPSNSHPII